LFHAIDAWLVVGVGVVQVQQQVLQLQQQMAAAGAAHHFLGAPR
jgi:hypothetical protein